MPISEDEYEHHRQSNMQSSMSKAEQRRSNKPIMEKRRRARINHCLNELKTLILDAMKKDPARHSKLEKADILEMTVKHLQTLQRQQLAVAVATDPSVLNKFKTGFSECAGEVSRYIGNMGGVETGMKQRLVAHLSSYVSGLQQITPSFSFPEIGLSGSTGNSSAPITTQGNVSTSSSNTAPRTFNEDDNNNQNASRIQVPPGIQLIPSRLPTGELALLVPNSSNFPFFTSALNSGAQPNFTTSSTGTVQINLQRPSNSAFTAVGPSYSETLRMTSPPLSPASSTLSFDENSQVSENFQRPQTPSPKEVTVSFPTPPGSLAHSGAFKSEVYQQFQVTSTSTTPEKNANSLKIEYKTVPIYQISERPTHKQSSDKSFQPLSVITSDKFKSAKTEHPRDFDERSVGLGRKRSYPVDLSEGLLTVATNEAQPSSSKHMKYSMSDVSTTSHSAETPDLRYSMEQQYHKPSTSGSTSRQEDANNETMWRPW